MFKSLRTAKELLEVLHINELNCFTQQVSTFLFPHASWVTYTSDFLHYFKDCFANKVVEFCHSHTHLNSGSKETLLLKASTVSLGQRGNIYGGWNVYVGFFGTYGSILCSLIF